VCSVAAAARRKEVSAQEPRRLKTRAALLCAGIDLLGDKPIEAIAIDEIVQRAGVAKGSFFNHFADKTAFADAIAQAIRQRVEEMVATVNAAIEDPALRVARGVACVAQFARAEPTQMRILLRVHGGQLRPDHPLNRGLKADLEAGIAEGRLKDFEVAAGTLYVIGISHMIAAATASGSWPGNTVRNKVAGILTLMLTGLGMPNREAKKIATRAADVTIS
jgi:AcrR family transcriptional regulator